MIPAGFTCAAWHNDTCPTWLEGESSSEQKPGDLMIGIDYADRQLREFQDPDLPRFHLSMYGQSDGFDTQLFESDDWTEIEVVVAYVRYVRQFGLGFHVDTRGASYAYDADGTRCFTDAEAAEYDSVVDAVHGFADPYELAFAVWRALGLIEA